MVDMELYDINGKTVNSFTQWNYDIYIQIGGVKTENVQEVRCSNKKSSNAICVKTSIKDGRVLFMIPNELLQECYPISIQLVYCYDPGGSKTEYKVLVPVIPAKKPDGYVSTPSEVKSWTELSERVDKLEQSGGNSGVELDTTMTVAGKAADAAAVGAALDQKQPKGDYLTDVPDGYAKTEDISSAINTALAQAKESGEFDGVDGKTAYEYARDGGYTGTEDEFSAKMAIPFVMPQMYGAVGDGVTDNTEAFRRALSENNNVYVPKGDYLITGTLDISYKKSLFSDDGQRATLLYNGTDSVINVGRMSVFRNINITIKNAFDGIIFDTNNYDKSSGEPGLSSRVEHVNVDFEVYSPNATLIGITVDSGADANNIPRLTGVCFQTYHDIQVDNSSSAYGYGIKMELIQGRAFTEEAKGGFPWITHIDYSDISLAHPHTAIKSLVTNTSGSELFDRVNIGHILFDNVYSQCLYNETTRYFLDLAHIGCYFTKCIPWDYHYYAWNGEKLNIIGEGVSACFSDCEMASGAEFLETCDFITETEYTVKDNPEYFMNKYFGGTVLSNGYDSVDAKIDSKMTGEYIANIAEGKINDILYSGYANVLDDPLTQIKVGQRWSGSAQAWVDSSGEITSVIIPILPGGNIIRWSPSTYALTVGYPSVYFFNTEKLTDGVSITDDWNNLWNKDGGYLQVDNPSGYKYVAIPFRKYDDISPETMTLTINREITGNDGQSYTEFLKESVIDPAVEKAIEDYAQPKGDYLTPQSALTVTGVDADGVIHTWTIYGVAQ